MQRTVIVTGGRDFSSKSLVTRTLDFIQPTLLIQGGATGADALAALWAEENHVECRTVPADWSKHGRAAGPIRNRQMLEQYREATVMAFPGGRGTADCMQAARERGMLVLEAYQFDEKEEGE